MPTIRINNIGSLIERIEQVIEKDGNGDEPLTLSKISEKLPIDRKSLRKWMKSGIVHAKQAKKHLWRWENGKLTKILTEPNGYHEMTLSELLRDLVSYRDSTKI